jgi:hypothetical protein
MATLIPTRLRRFLALGLAWLTLGAFSGGCDGLFRPATPEQPSSSTPVPTDYSEPDATLLTLAAGLEAKGQNGGTEAYLGAFADERVDGRVYHAFFYPADSARYAQSGGTVGTWTLAREQTFYQKFINNVHPSDHLRVEWRLDDSNPDGDPTTPDRTIHRHYTVLATSPDSSTTTVVAVGFADLTFYLSPQQRWVITIWNDRIDPDIVVNPEDPDPDLITLGRRRLEL